MFVHKPQRRTSYLNTSVYAAYPDPCSPIDARTASFQLLFNSSYTIILSRYSKLNYSLRLCTTLEHIIRVFDLHCDQNLTPAKYTYFSPSHITLALQHKQLPLPCASVVRSLVVKATSRAEVQHAWNFTFAPHTHLHCVLLGYSGNRCRSATAKYLDNVRVVRHVA
jgi:hypothetical protein